MVHEKTEPNRRFASEDPSESVLIVGDEFVASRLARALDGLEVTVVTDSPGVAALAADPDVEFVLGDRDERDHVPETFSVVEGELGSVRTLRQVGADEATAAVVAIERDESALLVTRLLKTTFDVPDVVTLINDPRVDAVIDDVETVCVTETVGSKVESLLEKRHVLTSR
jgi:Trk K+ transport system NAD-binding subunit